MPTHQVVDFGPGPIDQTQGYPFEGTEDECVAWMEANQIDRPDGEGRYAIQDIPDDDSSEPEPGASDR
jgi:hypothetical protein